MAVVEVDTETGSVELRRLVAVDDAGRIINPMVAEGQVHGGVVAGIAQALYERGKLKPGSRGLGFAVGKEPLSDLFASFGCDVVATDLEGE